MIPVTIVDNFFPNPDKIVEFALQQDFFPSEDGKWPGKRTRPLWEIDDKFFEFVVYEIIKYTQITTLEYLKFDMNFQLITPHSTEKYNKKNHGWIHKDKIPFGGIVYLNPNPEKDTGTSIYREKYGFSCLSEETESKTKLFRQENICENKYEQHFDSMTDQYEETIRVDNVYNRLMMFSGNTYHGVQTFGEFQDRLTLVFFCKQCLLGTAPICL